MARHPGYPFVPKSTAYLRPGDFWGVPLSNGRWGCGRVLATGCAAEDRMDFAFPGTRTLFLAGLVNWVGDQRPTTGFIVGATIIDQGTVHIVTIMTTGGEILGHRPLESDQITGLLRVSNETGTRRVYLGAVRQRRATAEDYQSILPLTTWGYGVITRVAEKCLVRGEEPRTRR